MLSGALLISSLQFVFSFKEKDIVLLWNSAPTKERFVSAQLRWEQYTTLITIEALMLREILPPFTCQKTRVSKFCSFWSAEKDSGSI